MDKRVAKTRALIQEAYFELLFRQSGKITISDIAKRANIDRKTFYLHYESVDDILRQFAQNRVSELTDQLRLDSFPSEPFNLTILFKCLTRIVENNLQFFRFISSHKEYDYFFEQLRELLINTAITVCRKYFDFTDTELTIYSEFYISGIISVYVRWLRDQLPLSLEELASYAESSVFLGLKDLLTNHIISIPETTI